MPAPAPAPAPDSSHWPLAGYSVVDLSTGLAGAYCTKLLADGGADVVMVEPPEGDPLRAWSESGGAIPDGDDAPLFRFLSTSKRSVTARPDDASDHATIGALIGAADVVVWSAGSPVAAAPTFAPATLHASLPSAVIVALSAFGLDGPWCDRPSTEFTLQALCGGHVQRGTADQPPLMCGGRPGEWAAGTYAAIGALASLRRVVETGVGDLVDVAILDSLMFSQPMYPVTYAQMAGRPLRRTRRCATPWCAPHERRVRRVADRDRATVARLLRHDRSRRLGRRSRTGADGVPVGPPLDVGGGHRRVDERAHRGRGRRAGHAAARARCRSGQRREPPALRPPRRAGLLHHQSARVRAARVAVPVRRQRMRRDRSSRPRASASTTPRCAPTWAPGRASAPPTPARTRPKPTSRCRWRGSASSTSPRSGRVR